MSGPYRSFFKRGLDVVGASMLLLLLAPLMLVVAVAVMVCDSGPALFRQHRVGRGGKLFTLWKFRSMPVATPDVPSAHAGALQTTAVGRIIRRTNIDELPQLLNIVVGDMSLVGPRPALPSQSELLAMRRERGVLAVRPGLTGLAQVCSYDGMPEAEKVRLEHDYVRSITLLGDVGILLRTVLYMLKPPPAY